MATANPFDLLGDDDNGDPTSLLNIAVKPSSKEKPTAKNKQSIPPAKLPARPLPPAEAVRLGRSTQSEGGRGRGGGRGGQGFANREQDFGYGRGRGSSYNGDRSFSRGNYGRDYAGPRGAFNEGDDNISGRREDGEALPGGRGRGGRGGRDAGADETRRRAYERRSGTGRGTEMKREGAGQGNWGTPVDQGSFQEIEEPLSAEDEKIATSEKHPENEDKQETLVVDAEKKKEEEEDKEMTLDEYEKLLEERRRTIMVTKLEERKVDAREFESMQQLTNKKNDDEYMLVKVTSEKDKLKKLEAGERDEKIRKAMSINEFLKPAEGERYYGRGRGRGRGRGDRGGFKGGFDGAANPHQLEALSIEDPGQFPSLGGK